MLYKQPICVRCAENILSERLLKRLEKTEQMQDTYQKPLNQLKKAEEDIKKRKEQNASQSSLSRIEKIEEEIKAKTIKQLAETLLVLIHKKQIKKLE